eukprot:3088399-Rhodomonas_salina.1
MMCRVTSILSMHTPGLHTSLKALQEPLLRVVCGKGMWPAGESGGVEEGGWGVATRRQPPGGGEPVGWGSFPQERLTRKWIERGGMGSEGATPVPPPLSPLLRTLKKGGVS